MRVCIRVFGIVQGVGFRPTVKRHADACDIAGSVSNKGPYVEIFAEGSEECVHSFIKQIQEEPPKRAVILKLDVENVESGEDGIHKVESETDSKEKFQIIESEKEEGEIFVSPDIAICPECKKELYDKNDRRYLHPFINCTCCGPRLTILDSMPYDRVRTSMGEFPMCEKCEYEYTHAETRRFDAQPVCCNDCGPEVYLLGRKERGADAIRYTRKVISEGGIVAVKGIGGFHLCCDAAKEETVARLRQRKKRPMKPFAVMMKDLDVVRRECETEPHLEEILDGHQKPIILLPKKEGGTLCESVAPDNPKIGVMLPYAPVQLLLFDYQDETKVSDCLVMTSANTSGAPICRDDEDALNELSGLCDVILSHDRKIRLRADDTVMDFYRGEPYMIRRSRGYAPLPFMMGNEFKGQVLAVGGELKNAFCIGKNQLFYPSPYIGDMGDVRTVKALKESVKRMEELLETKGNTDNSKLIRMLDAVNDYSIPIDTILEDYFDEENLTYWMGFQILMGNVDTQSRNVYLYSPLNSDTWYFIPWDNDGSLMRPEYKITGFSDQKSWESGVSNYWGNVLFQRCLKSERFREKLDEAILDLKEYLSEERLGTMIEKYKTVVKPYLYEMPDVFYAPLTSEQYDELAASLPEEIEKNYQL